MSKVDKVLGKKKKQVKTGVSTAGVEKLHKMLQDLKLVIQPDPRTSEGPGALGELVTCSAEVPVGAGQFLGVNAVRWAILSAAGIDGSLQGGQLARQVPPVEPSTRTP